MSPGYEPFVLALIFVGFGIVAKFIARANHDKTPIFHDFGVSTSVSLMTLGKIWTDVFSASTISHPLLFEAIIGGAAPFTFAVADRLFSWRVMPDGKAKKRIWWGIIFPDILAVVILFIYFQLRSGNRSP